MPSSEAFIERFKDKWSWFRLSENESLPWSESFIERFADKLNWEYLEKNRSVIKLFNSWTKQEIITALEKIRLASHRDDDHNKSGNDDHNSQVTGKTSLSK